MRTLLASSTVFLTIVFSFAFGIACGYLVIGLILHAMARKPKAAGAPVRATITTSAQSH